MFASDFCSVNRRRGSVTRGNHALVPWESGAEDARTPDADAWSADSAASAKRLECVRFIGAFSSEWFMTAMHDFRIVDALHEPPCSAGLPACRIADCQSEEVGIKTQAPRPANGQQVLQPAKQQTGQSAPRSKRGSRSHAYEKQKEATMTSGAAGRAASSRPVSLKFSLDKIVGRSSAKWFPTNLSGRFH